MSSIVSRSPFFNDVVRLYPWADLDNIAQDFGVRPSVMDKRNINLPSIKIDLTENDTAYTVRAEIPGIKKEDVTVEVDGNFVSISVKTKHEKEKKEGERVICRECYQGSSYRSFSLDRDVDESKSHAKYDGGVLELTLPKKQNGKTSKQLEIK
ncbi:MAG: Hsp20/alpha crystallin family protein [Candidatus Nitrotoga sp.]|jgi:HSP20 family protein|nr:Hsp20/alpha crystallin family protein [Candidatus Nitrotoga sp.]